MLPRAGEPKTLLHLLLVAGPLIVLAGMGLRFIAQDKYAVEREARSRAAEQAERLATEFHRSAVENAFGLIDKLEEWPDGFAVVQLDGSAQLLSPSPLQKSNPFSWNEPLASLRAAAERAEYQEQDLAKALDLWNDLLARNADERLQSIGRFHRALLALKSGDDPGADLNDLASEPLHHQLDSGLPVAHAAAWKQIELCISNNAADCRDLVFVFASNVVTHPSGFSEFLLSKAEDLKLAVLQPLRTRWERGETARALTAAPVVGNTLTNAGVRWFRLSASETNLIFLTEMRLQSVIASCAAGERILPYVRIQFSDSDGVLGETTPHPVLASAARGAIRCDLLLADANALFAQQTRRARWLMTLFLGASGIATAGLLQVFRSQRQQARLNMLKSNFVSSVSHELRAPLASMRLISEGLHSGRVNNAEKQAEYYKYLVQECRRLGAIIENVLDFSRMEQNRKQYEFELTDLAAVAQSAVRTVEPLATERAVRIEFAPTQDLTANADALAIQQALVNLLDNAIKHSPPGETVRIEITRDNDHIIAAVSDRGPGIPQSEQKRIFEWFYRLGSEARRETPGVGIGLTIVKHIAEAHRGSIELQSAPGEGSTFRLHLPADNESAG